VLVAAAMQLLQGASRTLTLKPLELVAPQKLLLLLLRRLV
jgi:hypothetical protein